MRKIRICKEAREYTMMAVTYIGSIIVGYVVFFLLTLL